MFKIQQLTEVTCTAAAVDSSGQPLWWGVIFYVAVVLLMLAIASAARSQWVVDSLVSGWLAHGWLHRSAGAWRRSRRPCKTIIQSPRDRYVVDKMLGNGDASRVYTCHSHRTRGLLKIAHTTACDQLLLKEQRVLQQLHEQSDEVYCEYFPVPRELFSWQGRCVSAFDYRGGFRQAVEIRRRFHHGVDPRHVAWMFNRILEALGMVHGLGWVHGAVLPPHLLFHPENHGLQLIGWVHAERRGSPLQVISKPWRPWYPPECFRHEPVTPASDIFLAAKSMIWMAGGNPALDSLPPNIPEPMCSRIFDCLADDPSLRPQDAWQLHAEFKDDLASLFGPPKFCHLNMS